jgi:RNA recognition motif-containing protein
MSAMKLMFLNLPRSFSENDLAKMCKQFGNIQSCDLVMDAATGSSKGFGFVKMAVAHEAEVAIKELNGKIIDKKKIRVKVAEE